MIYVDFMRCLFCVMCLMEIFTQYCVACRKWALNKSRSRCDYFAHIQCIPNSDLFISQDVSSPSPSYDVESFTIALLCIIVIMYPYYAKQQKRPARPFCHSYSYFTTISNCSFRIPHSRPEAHSIRLQNKNDTKTYKRKKRQQQQRNIHFEQTIH